MSLLQGVNGMDPNFASYFVRYGSYTDRLVTPGRAYPRVVPVKYFHPYGWKVHLSSTNSVSQYPSFTSSAIRYGNYTDRLLPGVKVCRKIVPMKVEPNPIANFLKRLLSETDDETPIKTTSPETQHYFTNFSKPQTQLLYDISQEDSWGYLDSKILSKFLDTEVRIPRNSTKKAVHNVIPKMQAVLQVVNKQDPRFSSELVSSGSYNDKLQVGDPDEFDFLVPLEDFPEIFPTDTNDIPEYDADRDRVPVVVKQNYAFLLEDGAASLFSWISKDVSDHMDINTYLVNPIKVMSLFKKYIRKAVKHLELTDCITVCNHYQGTPALTLIVQQGNTETNVDLVPFIKDPYNYWHLEWPREGSTWPSAEKIDECKMMGVDLVAKETVFWRYSFSRIEKFLLEGIDADGGFRKASLRILKKIRIDYWESRFRKVLVSYHLKVILFWACENYPDSDFWCDLNTSFRRLVDDLIDYLSETNLPHYFVDEVNMFKTDNDSKLKLQELCEEVKKLRRNPEQYLSIED